MWVLLLFRGGEASRTQEDTTKTQFVFHSSQRADAHHTCKTPCTLGSNRANQEAEGVGGKQGQENLLWFSWEGMSESGYTDLGWSMVNNFDRLWGVGLCLAISEGISVQGLVPRW